MDMDQWLEKIKHQQKISLLINQALLEKRLRPKDLVQLSNFKLTNNDISSFRSGLVRNSEKADILCKILGLDKSELESSYARGINEPKITSRIETNRKFAKLIFERRKELKLSRSDVKKLSNYAVSETDLSLYERGQIIPRMKKLLSLMTVLKIEPETLWEAIDDNR